MKHSESIVNIGKAIATVQQRLTTLVPQKKVNVKGRGGSFEYKYATLANGMDVLRPLLADNNLAVMQPTNHVPGYVVVETVLLHTPSGEFVASETSIPITQDTGAQAVGSIITYCRRYGLWSLIGLVVDDDDDGKFAEDHRRRSDWSSRESSKRKALDEIAACSTQEALEQWWETNQYSVADQDPDNVTTIKMAITKRHKELAAKAGGTQNATAHPEREPASQRATQPAEQPKPPTPAPAAQPAAPAAPKQTPAPAPAPKQTTPPAPSKKGDSNDPFSGFFN